MAQKNKMYVTASEVGDFVFCPRSWWLKINGISVGSNERMNEGSKQHIDLSENLKKNRIIVVMGTILIFIALVILIFIFASKWL